MNPQKPSINPIVFILNAPWKNWFFAATFLLVGFVQIEQGIKVYSLVCTRTGKAPHTCEISKLRLSRSEIKQFPLSQLKEAKLGKSSGSKMVTVDLITEKEVITFGSISNVHVLEKQNIVSEVNTFLQNPNQLTLSVKEPYSFSIISFGLMFSLAGLFIFFKKTKL